MIEQEFQEWLKQHNAYLTVAVRTPQGEIIRPENFIPQGWVIVVGVNTHERINELATAVGSGGDSSE